MENRGQKRTELVDELPADKRACSSFEFHPSTSNSSAQTPISCAHETQDADMDTSSSTSGSARSEVDGEKDSTYGSCDSDNSLRDYYRHRSTSDHTKLKKVLSGLSEEVEESVQLALLTELCESLSFCSDGSLSSLMADSFSPVLVRLARHDSNPDITLFSIRAITYLCDVNPRSASFLVRHDAVPALCQRLMAFEYLDVAEQCLQALEKISREQPLACLQSGAILTSLSYIDFFSTSVQRIALSTVVNICKKPSPESAALLMEAVPILCNLLQYEDKQLVESAATCLIKIGEQVNQSSDMLDEICNHGLVQHALHLIGLNSRTSLCQSMSKGLIGLLVKLAAGSTIAFKKLFELNISDTVKDMLSTYDISHGTQSIPMLDEFHSQIHEVLKLLNELLPSATAEQDCQFKSDKEAFLLDHPDILPKFGVDLLPILIHVVNSGVNLLVCYGSLSIIRKIIHFSTPEVLKSMLQTTKFSSFLAGIFTRKDHHVMLLALEIVDTLMRKLPHMFLNTFVKEGLVFAISALVSPNEELKLFPELDGMRLEIGGAKKSAFRNACRCPCFAFDMDQSSKDPENGTCKIKKDTVQNLARHVWTSYFETESVDTDKGVTDILLKLRALSSSLKSLLDKSRMNLPSSQLEKELHDLLHQIVSELNGKDSISTFEFVESGIIEALVSYLSNGRHCLRKQENNEANQWHGTDKRFVVFGKLILSCDDPVSEESFLLNMVRRLQGALSSVENFPVISSQMFKWRNSYATIPYGRCTSYPCLRVQFVREKGENMLSDYNEDAVSVDPFVPLGAIEGYLWPRVKSRKAGVGSKNSKKKHISHSHSPLDSSNSRGERDDRFVSTEMHEDVNNSKDGKAIDAAKDELNITRSTDVTDVHSENIEQEENDGLKEDTAMNTDCPGWCNSIHTPSNLCFYLEGQHLDCELTLYQSILKQLIAAEKDNITISGLWTRVYKISYGRNMTAKSSQVNHCFDEAQCTSSSKLVSFGEHFSSNFQNFFSEGDLESLGPTYYILSLLKSLERINRMRNEILSCEKGHTFAQGSTDDLDKSSVSVHGVSQNEFINSKLTEKLEQQIRDPVAVSVGGMPAWCTQIMARCPFLFGFESRCKYFQLAAFGRLSFPTHSSSHISTGNPSGWQQNHGNFPRKKFLVHRNAVLESAAQMMELHTQQKFSLEVEYNEEVGTGLGPALEFYTLVCREFQRCGLGMWRDDHVVGIESVSENPEFLVSPHGLFPRPWLPSQSTSTSIAFSQVIKKFSLLGQMVAKALQEGRVLDLPLSSAFYKLVLGKELTVHDIQSFDPALGKALFEFQAIVERKKDLKSLCEDSHDTDVFFQSTKIEDLCLDFTLPGYPDYDLVSATDAKMVNLNNLKDYVDLIIDATTKSGISSQLKAFKSGFDEVFHLSHLKVFTEEELERLLCGEPVLWNADELLEYIIFDHGYTISSPPITNLLEIMREFDHEQQRAFLQFVTGAPRLPIGGLASLNPKLTIVRKTCGQCVDADLPSVMTCANYLKLPPYSSKEVMKKKLLVAITEGQGSFHLS